MNSLLKTSMLGGAALLALAANSAQAEPALQLYIEGATYCSNCPGGFTENWAISGTTGLRMWVVGDTNLYNVQLVMSYNHPPLTNAPDPVLHSTTIGAAAFTGGIVTN